MADESANLKQTLILPRNFSVPTAERVRAIIAGPPAYAVRKRRIEDLEVRIVSAIAAHEARTSVPLDSSAPPPVLARSFALLKRLVEHHNAYYPIEANLPVDVATGELLELGKRWHPMPAPSLEELIARARAQGMQPS